MTVKLKSNVRTSDLSIFYLIFNTASTYPKDFREDDGKGWEGGPSKDGGATANQDVRPLRAVQLHDALEGRNRKLLCYFFLQRERLQTSWCYHAREFGVLLINCGLVTPYGAIYVGWHWLPPISTDIQWHSSESSFTGEHSSYNSV